MKNSIRSTRTVLLAALLLVGTLAPTIPTHARPPVCDALNITNCDPPPDPSPGGRWRIGKDYAYHYTAHITGQSTGTTSDNGTQTHQNNTQMTATAHFVPLRQQNGNMLIGLMVQDPDLTYVDENGQTVHNVQDQQAWVADLARFVYFEQTPAGEIDRFFYLPSDQTQSVNIKRSIIAAMQTYAPDGAVSAAPITIAETDTLGHYQAEYSIKKDGGKTIVTKRRLMTAKASTSAQTARPGTPDDDPRVEPIVTDAQFQIEGSSTTVIDNTTGNVVQSTGQSQVQAIPDNTPPPAGVEDGARIVSQAMSNDELMLISISAITPPGVPALEDGTYNIAPDLSSGTSPADNTPTYNDVSRDTAVALLDSEPGDPNTLIALTNALRTDETTWDDMPSYLLGQRGTPEARSTVIGALTTIGDARAQQLLTDYGMGEGNPPDAQSQVLVALSTLPNPTLDTVEKVQSLSDNAKSPVHEQATLVLGAVASAIARKDPDKAAEIGKTLLNQLNQIDPSDEAGKAMLLGAVGNSGFVDALPDIAKYLGDDAPTVRLAAVHALRKLPNTADVLTQAAKDTDPSVSQTAQEMLGLASPTVDAKQQENSSKPSGIVVLPLVYDRTWTKTIGSGDINARISAQLRARSSPNLDLLARGEAAAKVWVIERTLVRAELASNVVTGTLIGGAYTQTHRFSGGVWVLGNQVAGFSRTGPGACGIGVAGDLLPMYSRTFFDVAHTFIVYGLPIRLTATAAGHVGVSYDYSLSACGADPSVTAAVKVTPRAWISAEGTAGLHLVFIRVGAGIAVDLLRTELPVSGSATFRALPRFFQTCGDVALTFQPLRGKVFVFYQLAFLWWHGRRHDHTLWQFQSQTYQHTFLHECLNL